jgi:hypothetical protein
MRRLVLLVIILAPATVAWAQMGKGEQQVLEAEKARFAAMVKADRAALEQLLAEDLTYTHTNAMFESKPQFLKSVTSGAIDYVSIAPNESDWKVRIEGNLAIVNGTAAINVIDKGNDLKFRARFTTVHRNQGGRWLLASWHATRFPQ